MSAINFTSTTGAEIGRCRSSIASMPNGDCLTVYADRRRDTVEIGLLGGMAQCWMVFTAEQARAMAAELLACVDALESSQRGAV